MEDTLDTEETCKSIVINSTKQPLPTKDCRPKKRQKRERQEDVLLEKAIACMDKSVEKTHTTQESDNVFCKYMCCISASNYTEHGNKEVAEV